MSLKKLHSMTDKPNTWLRETISQKFKASTDKFNISSCLFYQKRKKRERERKKKINNSYKKWIKVEMSSGIIALFWISLFSSI